MVPTHKYVFGVALGDYPRNEDLFVILSGQLAHKVEGRFALKVGRGIVGARHGESITIAPAFGI